MFYFEWVSLSAITFLMLLFSISSYMAEDMAGASSTFLLGVFAGAAFAGAAAWAGFAVAAAITSSFKILPTGPLPTIPSREMPFSLAVILAMGLANILSPEAFAAAGVAA